ncbi:MULTISPECIES: ABC transporter substrate-binding protein [Listeria]|uniref:ABC transporter substrate-binding protein n=1 Tax=Listeria TaxID=1637 RepID=UPI000B58AE3D|nr:MULTISPECIES: ABC transporter substrate-binding protein [Listeria]
MDFDYFKLRTYLENHSCSFKLAEIANLWYCSPKNAKRKIQAYATQNLLYYSPGRGRGHLSSITFTQSFLEDITSFLGGKTKEERLSCIATFLESDLPPHILSFITEEFRQLFNTQLHEGNTDVLRMMMRRKISTLEPKRVSTSIESFLLKHLSDTLVIFNRETQKIEPWLAHHFSSNATKTSWTFYLRKGVSFHNGRYLTSEDVTYSLYRAKEADSVVAHFLKDIRHIELVSTYILRIHLVKPDPFFIRYLTSINVPILPKNTIFDEMKWISTGPFRLSERSGNKITLEAFDGYFMPRALLDKIEFWYIEGAEKLNDVRFSYGLEKSDEHYVKTASQSSGVSAVCFNFQKQDSLIQNKAFREAIYHLFDGQLIGVSKERQAASYFKSGRNPGIRKDAKQIPSLLEKSGYDGRIIYLGIFDRPIIKQNAEIFRQQALAFGLQMEWVPINLATDYYDTSFQKLDFIWLEDEPGADMELGYMEFFTNPHLFPKRFLSEKILATVAPFLEDMKFGETFLEREKSRMSLDTWLTENFFLFYVAYGDKTHNIDSHIRGVEDMIYGYFSLSKVWVPLSE